MKYIQIFPKGTTFTVHAYSPDWEPYDMQQELDRVKAMLAAQGMKLGTRIH
jgi:hypothetical protein